jgi:hypothetical protein
MNEIVNQLTVLRQEIQRWDNSTHRSRVYYRKMAYYLYLSIAIFSSLTTVLIGLKIDRIIEYTRIGALILSAAITILSAMNFFFNFKELWVAYDTAIFKLGRLTFDINMTEANNTLNQDSLKDFRNRLEGILQDLNNTWQKNRQSK